MNETNEVLCYVYVQGNEKDIEKFYELVRKSKNDELILYPERGMTFVDTVCYCPYVKPVVTENPYIISCYSANNVRILVNGRWEIPDRQTYASSVNLITMTILHYGYSIPMLPCGGFEEIEAYRHKVEEQNFK